MPVIKAVFIYYLNKIYLRAISPEEIDEDDGKDHEDGDDEEEDLAPLLSLALEDNGIETALLEERGAVLVVMVVVMVMLLFRHKM